MPERLSASDPSVQRAIDRSRKLKQRLERRLAQVEHQLDEQVARIMTSTKGFNGPEGLYFDKRLIERHTLRWALGKQWKPHCAADFAAGW